MAGLSLIEDKSPKTLFSVPSKNGYATTHFPTVFDKLYCELDRAHDEKSRRPERRRNIAIRWVETDELFLDRCHSRVFVRQGKLREINPGVETRLVGNRRSILKNSNKQKAQL